MHRSNTTILIVDDEPAGRDTLEAILYQQGYDLVFAANGAEALDLAVSVLPDLILLDVMMPGMDGFEVCRRLRADWRVAEVPVILITALDDRESHIAGFEAGADDFVSKPFDRFVLRARVRSVTRLNRYRHLHNERAKFERVVSLAPDGLVILDEDGTIQFANPAWGRLVDTQDTSFKGRPMGRYLRSHECFFQHMRQVGERGETSRWESVIETVDGNEVPIECVAGAIEWEGKSAVQLIVRDITERKQAQSAIERSNIELAEAYDATLEGWVAFLDLRDKETEGHTQRVTEMTLRLAEMMNIPSDQFVHVRRGALLHDIGKMGIPDRILLKPGPLTDDEWEIMRKHPVYAHHMLEPISFLRPALDIPYHHHEKWDGSGYPLGLKGEEIPMFARLFAVIDVWDALSSDRPYRPGWSQERVRAHITAQSGSHFDPAVVSAFQQLLDTKT